MFLRLGTAKVVNFGTVLDTSLVPYAGAMASTDAKIYKNGTEGALDVAATFTHKSNGRYLLSLTASDTDTLGRIEVGLVVAGAFALIPFSAVVLPAKVYDSIVAGSDNLEVDTIQWLGTAPKTPTTAGVPKVDLDAILGTTLTESVGGYLAGRFKDMLNSAVNPYQRFSRAMHGRKVWYVDAAGDNTDGLTPQTAYTTIAAAIAAMGTTYGDKLVVMPSATPYAGGFTLAGTAPAPKVGITLEVRRGATITSAAGYTVTLGNYSEITGGGIIQQTGTTGGVTCLYATGRTGIKVHGVTLISGDIAIDLAQCKLVVIRKNNITAVEYGVRVAGTGTYANDELVEVSGNHVKCSGWTEAWSECISISGMVGARVVNNNANAIVANGDVDHHAAGISIVDVDDVVLSNNASAGVVTLGSHGFGLYVASTAARGVNVALDGGSYRGSAPATGIDLYGLSTSGTATISAKKTSYSTTGGGATFVEMSQADLRGMIGTGLTETVAGYMAGRFKDMFDSVTNPYQRVARSIFGRKAWYVDNTNVGAADGLTPQTAYTTIAAAVAAAASGELIIVMPSTTDYAGGFSLALAGPAPGSLRAGKSLMVLPGAKITVATGSCVTAGNYSEIFGGGIIENTGATASPCVYASGKTGIYVHHLTIDSANRGIEFGSCKMSRIGNNNITGTEYGIYLQGTGSYAIQDVADLFSNQIKCSGWLVCWSEGIYIEGMKSVRIADNVVGVNVANGDVDHHAAGIAISDTDDALLVDNLSMGDVTAGSHGFGIFSRSTIGRGVNIILEGGEYRGSAPATANDLYGLSTSGTVTFEAHRARYTTTGGTPTVVDKRPDYKPVVDASGNSRAVDATGAAIAPAATALSNVLWNAEKLGYIDAAISGTSTFDPAIDTVDVNTCPEVQLSAVQPSYAPAKAGDEMALTAAERAAINSTIGKTGYKLAADGLDQISAAEPTVKPTTFPGWIMWLVQKARRSKLTNTTLTVETEAGVAVTTQPVSDDGATQRLGPPT